MIESVDIDFGLENVWKSWFDFRKGKKSSSEIEWFEYNLERELAKLSTELMDGSYHLQKYRQFMVYENKKRLITVAAVRDRVVQRLVYNYLLPIIDPQLTRDVWSCRPGKGLLGAITQTQNLLRHNPNGAIVRFDVKQFFASIDRNILLKLVKCKIRETKALGLIQLIITENTQLPVGIPIGNLTSQILANLYLNELDRYILFQIKPLGYVRYGDDGLLVLGTKTEANQVLQLVNYFLLEKLKLALNPKNTKICLVKAGAHFLGVEIFSTGLRLKSRVLKEMWENLSAETLSSYFGVVKTKGTSKNMRYLRWRTVGLTD